ncbi:MAG TPA: 16S rRNA (guanine(527)-N(7))-methyltransferase RsmG [Pyrinomonadaceae bacterium]|jgi:16S rRNA (guanine527-N7)-methyltransferase|nr:16S rRNA (guanine(527)-N(7))-methyltransferase RsmG [Pyrinomonadaceae bacterium]
MNDQKLSPADEFVNALRLNSQEFSVTFAANDLARLRAYYELTMRWNARLHLVAPCTPPEFAVRHVLESLVALQFIQEDARLIDVGSGAGLPAIPCLVQRPGARATLVESSTKKTVFLREALRCVGRHERASVVAARFEETHAPAADVVTCRALDRFKEMLASLIRWSPPASTLLIFGGPAIRDELERITPWFQSVHIPQSEQRFLFAVERRTIDESPTMDDGR